MTLRLVALMSVVLLLSLAAFGLLMAHFQERVLQGVAETASAVGRETLRTLEWSGDGGFPSASGGRGVLIVGPTDAPPPDPRGKGGARDIRQSVERMIVLRHFESERLQPMLKHVERLVEDVEEEKSGLVTVEALVALEGEIAGEDEAPGCVVQGTACVDAQRRPLPGTGFVIDLERIRAEPGPGHGLVLRIPGMLAAGAAPAAGDDVKIDVQRVGDGPPTMTVTRREEITLPISLDHYRHLFGSMRGRSLALFLGVFVVGSVLSAGLASRFTRPIRRLDAGIRRLSEGDLQVEVPVHGKDEIARLSRAFNEMAAKLRAHRERDREMMRAEKLSALGRLAAGVAHDVRNPLHSIGLTLQHLRDAARPADDDRAGEFDRATEIIRGEIRRLDRMVGDFLRFAKSERQERGEVAMTELLAETARLVRKEAEWRKVDLQLDLDPETPAVLADGEAIRSAVLNLVLNAFEAMPDGGRLTVALRPGKGEVLIEVSDTGEGIPEEDRERVFDFAYTTREGGSGLGLALVHHCVVEEHGGRIQLESKAGEGTRVRLALPEQPPGGTATS